MPTESCKCHLVNSKDPEFFHFKVAEGEEKKMFAKSFYFSPFEKDTVLRSSELLLTDGYRTHATPAAPLLSNQFTALPTLHEVSYLIMIYPACGCLPACPPAVPVMGAGQESAQDVERRQSGDLSGP